MCVDERIGKELKKGVCVCALNPLLNLCVIVLKSIIHLYTTTHYNSKLFEI